MNRSIFAFCIALLTCLITLPAWAEQANQPSRDATPLPRPPATIPPRTVYPGVVPQRPTKPAKQNQPQRMRAGDVHVSPSLQMTSSLALEVEAQDRDPVNSAYAPGMAVSNGTCYGTGGLGITAAAFSISGGGPTLDEGCDARYDAASLIAVGEVESAVERLCMKPEIREARRNAGRPCLADTPNAPGAVFTEVCLDSTGQPYTDPLVAARACQQ